MDLSSFQEFCEKLKIDTLDGNRALSRRHVTSGQAGENGDFWIETESLKKYILLGAPNLRRPADVTATGFDHGALRATGDVWASKVRGELEALIPDAPPADGVNEVRISPTSGDIPKLLTTPTPTTAITPDVVRRVVRWADCYLVVTLRQHATTILREKRLSFAKIYDPANYSTITSEALSRLKRGSISAQKIYPAAEAWRQPRRVSFELSHSDIIGSRGAELINLAF